MRTSRGGDKYSLMMESSLALHQALFLPFVRAVPQLIWRLNTEALWVRQRTRKCLRNEIRRLAIYQAVFFRTHFSHGLHTGSPFLSLISLPRVPTALQHHRVLQRTTTRTHDLLLTENNAGYHNEDDWHFVLLPVDAI